MNWNHTSSDSYICAVNISPNHHMTIHTHGHALTYTHTAIYVHRRAQPWTQHMYIITTSHTKTSLDAAKLYVTYNKIDIFTFAYICITTTQPHITRNNITSHTHIQIRKTSHTPGIHIVNTLPKWHACTCTYIHTYIYTYIYTYIHTHKLTHHHPSVTLILPLPLLLFCAQSKSGEVVNMWGYPVL